MDMFGWEMQTSSQDEKRSAFATVGASLGGSSIIAIFASYFDMRTTRAQLGISAKMSLREAADCWLKLVRLNFIKGLGSNCMFVSLLDPLSQILRTPALSPVAQQTLAGAIIGIAQAIVQNPLSTAGTLYVTGSRRKISWKEACLSGLGANMVRNGSFNMLYIPLRSVLLQGLPEEVREQKSIQVLVGILAGLISTGGSYPFDTVAKRSRVEGRKSLEVAWALIKEANFKDFYRGSMTACLRMALVGGVLGAFAGEKDCEERSQEGGLPKTNVEKTAVAAGSARNVSVSHAGIKFFHPLFLSRWIWSLLVFPSLTLLALQFKKIPVSMRVQFHPVATPVPEAPKTPEAPLAAEAPQTPEAHGRQVTPSMPATPGRKLLERTGEEAFEATDNEVSAIFWASPREPGNVRLLALSDDGEGSPESSVSMTPVFDQSNGVARKSPDFIDSFCGVEN